MCRQADIYICGNPVNKSGCHKSDSFRNINLTYGTRSIIYKGLISMIYSCYGQMPVHSKYSGKFHSFYLSA